MKPDLVFVCRKCGHHLFIDNKPEWVKKLVKTDCPSCGEEAEELWLFSRTGDYFKESDEFRKIKD